MPKLREVWWGNWNGIISIQGVYVLCVCMRICVCVCVSVCCVCACAYVCVVVVVCVCVCVCVSDEMEHCQGWGYQLCLLWEYWPQFTQHGHTLNHNFPPPPSPSPTPRNSCRTIQHGSTTTSNENLARHWWLIFVPTSRTDSPSSTWWRLLVRRSQRRQGNTFGQHGD